MSANKFKVGDKIIRVSGSRSFGGMNEGDTGIVSKIDETGVTIVGRQGVNFSLDSYELFEDTPKPLGGIKHDQDKVDLALMPIGPMLEVAKVWTFGKKKYSAWNWTNGFIWSRPYAAALRHIFAWASGQDKDPETGLPHLAHAICCLQMLLEFQEQGTGLDDRFKTYKENK